MNYRRGIVSELDVATHRLRARLVDRDDSETGWLDVLVPSTAADKVVRLPAPGNQVALLLDERDEAGCVLGALYSQADTVPAGAHEALWRVEFRDGGSVEYDAEASVVRLTPPSGGVIELAGSAKRVALAEDVQAEFAAVKSELQAIQAGAGSHTHPFVGVAPGAPGMTSPPAAPPYSVSYEPSEVGAKQVRSA